MVEIGRSDKLTNLWPATPGRAIDPSGAKKHPAKKHQQPKKHNSNKHPDEDGPGKNIDEYA